ncbi:uncharacterized protein LOC128141052 isoform X1 [Harpia harpyja]|uniref:uncharacterized protein LOC128141052 isoform X1 n=1 Tax=Harpia harpyja TaxID=202280 RepID=UPI0022B1BEB8|nr:uncharacterized protein LOC128141052 isoform X1 [Harpia harpyja]
MLLSPSLSPAPWPFFFFFPHHPSCFLSLVFLPLCLCPAACLIVSSYNTLSSQLSLFSFLSSLLWPYFFFVCLCPAAHHCFFPSSISCLNLHLVPPSPPPSVPPSCSLSSFLSFHVPCSIPIFFSLSLLPFLYIPLSCCSSMFFPSIPLSCSLSLTSLSIPLSCCLSLFLLSASHCPASHSSLLVLFSCAAPQQYFVFLQLSDLLPTRLVFSLSFFPLPCTSLCNLMSHSLSLSVYIFPAVLVPVPLLAYLSLSLFVLSFPLCSLVLFFSSQPSILLPIAVMNTGGAGGGAGTPGRGQQSGSGCPRFRSAPGREGAGAASGRGRRGGWRRWMSAATISPWLPFLLP